MELPAQVIAEAKAHAAREYPRESCGLLVRARESGASAFYLPCANMAEGLGDFRMAPNDLAVALDCFDVLAVVHSHPNAQPIPSEADRVMMARWGLPWLIVGWPTGAYAVHQPSSRGCIPPLEGRQFSHGVLDCFALIRDYYQVKLGLDLPDFHRDDNWWLKGQNLYADLFPEAGFLEIPLEAGPREHDVLLMQVAGSPVINHAGVFLGDTRLIHHLSNRLSRVDLWTDAWRRRTIKIVRHKSLC